MIVALRIPTSCHRVSLLTATSDVAHSGARVLRDYLADRE
jgi:hypothetical protein